MILRDVVAQRLAEKEYLIPWQGSLVPSAHATSLHAMGHEKSLLKSSGTPESPP